MNFALDSFDQSKTRRDRPLDIDRVGGTRRPISCSAHDALPPIHGALATLKSAYTSILAMASLALYKY